MAERTEISRYHHPNGVVSKTVEKVEHESGLIDLRETYFSTSGIRFVCFVKPYHDAFPKPEMYHQS